MMDTRAPVSVIIPCFCCAFTIGRAVESILSQTMLPVELILVDDCSNDGGLTIAEIKKIQGQYQNEIEVVVQETAKNVGPGSSRNLGWSVATQPYIAFLDADDSWHPQKIEIQFDFLNKHNDVDLCGHLSQYVPDVSLPPTQFRPEDLKWKFLTLNEMLFSNYLPTRSVLLKRNIPLRFNDSRNAEDYLLWMQIIASGYRVALVNLPLAYSFRPPFSAGGLSGQLWVHEKGELKVLHTLYLEKMINVTSLLIAGVWSLAKFIRRSCIRYLSFNKKNH